MTPALPVELNRWGRVGAPPEDEGSFILVEPETGEGWKQPRPKDAYRVWHRRPGVPDDHDDNWTTWLTSDGLSKWFGTPQLAYRVEWLPEGVEPKWQKRLGA